MLNVTTHAKLDDSFGFCSALQILAVKAILISRELLWTKQASLQLPI